MSPTTDDANTDGAIPQLWSAPQRPAVPHRPARHNPDHSLPPEQRSPIPASAAWREGDEIGHRQFAHIGPLRLEGGGHLPAVRIAFESWGTLNKAADNAVLVLHALTGDSHVIGEAGPGHATAGWWESMVGPDKPIDTNRWYVIAPNVLGGCQGTTGPASLAPDGKPWGSRFPHISVRDQVEAESRLADALGIDQFALVIGGSMGGLRALEWAAGRPERVARVAAIATTAQVSADQAGGLHTQIAAITHDAAYRGGDYYDAAPGDGPHRGLGLARQIAHLTYRSAIELDQRFGRIPQGAEEPLAGGRLAVQSYLDHHADKIARRFDANSYVVLTQSMLTHDLGRDRGGVESALGAVTARTLVIAVDSDRLFSPAQSERIAAAIPGSGRVRTIHSDYGHDGFLVETEQAGTIVADFLNQ